MQDQRTTSYSYIKTQLDIDWEEERRALVEEQKIIRQRAQKLSVETNRRRKALEDKRREEELKEQRFREEVLQQRKLKLQEATEKFQRAHLPPSQRRRTAYVVTGNKKPNPKLEDALRQIQSSLSSTFYYMSNHRSPNARGSDSPSSTSSIGTSTWSKRQEPAPKLAFERVYQEKSVIQFDSDQLYFQNKLEEAQRLLEEQHLSNIQNFHQEVEQLAHSESLSSLDSLEEGSNTANEEINTEEFPADTLHRALSEISSLVNSGNHYISESNSGVNSGKSSPESHPIIPDLRREQNLSVKDEEWHRSAVEQAVTDTTHNGSSYATFSSTQELNHFSQMPTAQEKASYSDMGYRESTTVVVRPSKAWATPDPTPREAIQTSVPHNNKDMVQSPGLSIKPTMTQPLATPIVAPLSGSSTSNCQPNSDLKQSKHVHEIHSANSDGITNSYYLQSFRAKSDQSKPVESSNQSTPSRGYLSSPNLVSNTVSGVAQDEKEDQKKSGHTQNDPDSAFPTFYVRAKTNSAGKDGHRLLKSILKKGSKYEKGYNRTLGIGKMFQLGEKSSDGLRDSVELAKEKENKKNKKLRWLDEMDKIMDNKEASGTIRTVEATLKPKVEPSAAGKFMEHVLVPTVSLTDQAGPCSGTPSSVYSTGYHFTKQAWMTTKGEENNSVGHTHAIRTPPKAKTKIAKRPKSAKAQSVVAYRNRRGVIIRPQSATEASKIAKTQAKVMVPRPPPRPATDNNNSETIKETKTQPVNINISHVNHLNSAVQSPSHGLPRDAMPSKTLSRSLGNIIAAQQGSPPDVENATKSMLTMNSERVLALQESLPVSSKRIPVYGENGLRLDHTPTDEEIALLWQGVRSALSHKNSAAGEFRPGDLPSNLQTRPNLSHVIIDGGTLSNWKSLSRMNGCSSPFVNGYVTLPRRRQIVDNNENKRKALLEQRKGRPGSAGWRPPLSQNFHAVKINPFPSTHEPAQAHAASASAEVSESTAQFMLAENLVETSATDGEILAAMQTLQANKHNLQSHKSPNAGHTALSIEEQRLLQSLDRLNQRLQTVQDTMIKPPGAANGFPMKSTLNIHHIPAQPVENAVPLHKHRSLSADPRTRLQRRY